MKKTKSIVVAVLAGIWANSAALAGEFGPQDTTPTERIVENEEKVERNPELRNARTPAAHLPASADSQGIEVDTNKILEIIQKDERLKNSALKIKVTATNGVVKLEGVVNSEAEKARVAELAMIENVTGVESALTVKLSDANLLTE